MCWKFQGSPRLWRAASALWGGEATLGTLGCTPLSAGRAFEVERLVRPEREHNERGHRFRPPNYGMFGVREVILSWAARPAEAPTTYVLLWSGHVDPLPRMRLSRQSPWAQRPAWLLAAWVMDASRRRTAAGPPGCIQYPSLSGSTGESSSDAALSTRILLFFGLWRRMASRLHGRPSSNWGGIPYSVLRTSM